MNGPVRALLFDLDGTLVDSRADITAAANAALAPLGFGPFPMDQVVPHVGRGAAALLSSLSGLPAGSERLETAVQGFIAYYRENLTRHTRLYPGIAGVLDHFRAIPLFVVSNKPAVLTRGVLEALGVAERFVAILGGDSLPRKKPDPLPILEALRPHEIPPEEAVMVGDSALDVRAGRAAGCETCGVLYGLGSRLELEQAGADVLIERAIQLIDVYG